MGPFRTLATGLRHSHDRIRAVFATYTTAHDRIFNPLSEARDQSRILMDASRVRYLLRHDGNSIFCLFKIGLFCFLTVKF